MHDVTAWQNDVTSHGTISTITRLSVTVTAHVSVISSEIKCRVSHTTTLRALLQHALNKGGLLAHDRLYLELLRAQAEGSTSRAARHPKTRVTLATLAAVHKLQHSSLTS